MRPRRIGWGYSAASPCFPRSGNERWLFLLRRGGRWILSKRPDQASCTLGFLQIEKWGWVRLFRNFRFVLKQPTWKPDKTTPAIAICKFHPTILQRTIPTHLQFRNWTSDLRHQTILDRELTLEVFSSPFLLGLFPLFSASVWCLKSMVSYCLNHGLRKISLTNSLE